MGSTSALLVDIAVLDEDNDFRHYLGDILTREGLFSVRSFTYPKDLVESCQQRLPSIILLDIKTSSSSGEKFLEELLGRWPELCLIIVSGCPSFEDMRTAFKLKVFDYLIKPLSLSQLRDALTKAIDAYGFGRGDADLFRHRLGHRIRLLRVEKGWSLKELADATRLSISQISSIERGTHCPSVESLLAVSRVFAMRPSQLLSEIDF